MGHRLASDQVPRALRTVKAEAEGEAGSFQPANPLLPLKTALRSPAGGVVRRQHFPAVRLGSALEIGTALKMDFYRIMALASMRHFVSAPDTCYPS
jgi:hypothetical protein